MSRPRRPPPPVWWTEADQSELDLLVRALVHGWHDSHRSRCEACQTNGVRCPHLAEAVDAVVGWVEWRRLRSKAAWLRRGEDAA